LFFKCLKRITPQINVHYWRQGQEEAGRSREEDFDKVVSWRRQIPITDKDEKINEDFHL